VYKFDQDTAVRSILPNFWQGNVSKDWFLRVAPNGGYMFAMAARAMGQALSQGEEGCDPVSLTANFIAPATQGMVDIDIMPLRQGRRFSQATAIVKQNGQACLQLSGSFGHFDKLKGAQCSEFIAPGMPSIKACKKQQMPNMPFQQQVDIRLASEDLEYYSSGGKREMEIRGYVRFADGRPADFLSLLLFADAFPRALMMRTGPIGWIPTMDLTVQCLAMPAPGFIAARFQSVKLAKGILEERGEMWDSNGTLVAVCRQAAVPRVPAQCSEQLSQKVTIAHVA